jgi:carbamate kinase
MLVVVALGGNALLVKGEVLTAVGQRRRLAVAARALADIAGVHDLVVTHGNGPQVGYLAALHEQADPGAFPLDVIDAESDAMIGYLLGLELGNVVSQRDIVTVLTQVQVDPTDDAFAYPTKPIGAVVADATARRLAGQFGWRFRDVDGGRRRVVASPRPVAILELRAIELLVHAGVIVVCAGGGGIPVVIDRVDGNRRHGVEAVVDKDLTTSLLARTLHADCVLFLTDVDAVYEDWGSDTRRPIHLTSSERLRCLHLDAGTMGPKVLAACEFVELTGGRAAIGSLDQCPALLAGTAGTQIGRSGPK